MTDVSVGVMAKRKRGRPRKDSNVCREGSFYSAETSTLMNMKTQVLNESADATNKMKEKECIDEGMVGSMVHGVVEGSFDAGYLISVRIGTNLTPFRGVVFQPRKVVAVTAANDVAPQARMYQRREIPVPSYDDNNNNNPNESQPQQGVLPYNHSSTYMPTDEATSAKQFPHVHLRMVEEDEVMQAFEVSTSSNLNGGGDKQSKAVESAQMAPPQPAFQMNAGESGQAMKSSDLYYNQGRSQDVNLFKGDSTSKSPNLQLDLAFTVNKEKAQMGGGGGGDGSIYSALINGMKNPSMGYHQALVSGNPLLLPPDLIGEPLEFMMKCKTSEETNMEVQSRLAGGEEGEGVGTRIADMDFVLSHPTQSNGHGISPFPSHNNQS